LFQKDNVYKARFQANVIGDESQHVIKADLVQSDWCIQKVDNKILFQG